MAVTLIAVCEGFAVAASEKVMLDPRALYGGGLAGCVPPWQYSLRGPMHEVRWTQTSVRSLKSEQLGFAGVVESEPE